MATNITCAGGCGKVLARSTGAARLPSFLRCGAPGCAPPAPPERTATVEVVGDQAFAVVDGERLPIVNPS